MAALFRPGVLVCATAAALLLSNPAFTFIDDEIAIISVAAQPLAESTAQFAAGVAQHEHPPAYDVLLHFWIRATGGRMAWLRVPAVVFYVAGLWLLSSVARRRSGLAAQRAVLFLGALWPFGFHFGRLAGWYSFSFMCVAFLTWAYVRFRDSPTPASFVTTMAGAALLVYTNYYGWAIVCCLAFDDLIDHRFAPRRAGAIAATLLLLLALFMPVVPALTARLADGLGTAYTNYTAVGTLLYAGFNLYSLFVSESVAPWFLWLSVPVLVSIGAVLLLVLVYGESLTRRLFVYFILLFAGMSVLGIIGTKRLLLISAWPLLAVSVALVTIPRPAARRALAGALVVIGSAGWFGIASRTYYSAPRFIEPWRGVAADAAARINDGALVVGSNPSFFFHLTYALRPGGPGWVFPGTVTVHSRHPQVFDAASWVTLPEPPVRGATLFVQGAHDPRVYAAAERAEQWLDAHCVLGDVDRLLRDSGFAIKQRYFPEAGRPEYRIEVREYSCPTALSSARAGGGRRRY